MNDARRRGHVAGFTLVELIIVMVAITVLGSYAFMKNGSVSEFSVRSQANTLAANIRHMQSLATSWDQPLTLTFVTPGTYSLGCPGGGNVACSGGLAIDPATGAAFSGTLDKNVTFGAAGTLTLDKFGRPSAAFSIQLSGGAETVTVSVADVTGFVTVAP